MKTYSVAVPITGIVVVEVKAENEEAAIEAALVSEELTLENIQEWEAHEQIVRGNVFYGTQNRADAELIDEGDDE